MDNVMSEILYLQFNREIIAEFKKYGIHADTIGSVSIVLYALRAEKMSILDELDDASNEKRMLMLYQEMKRKGLLEEDDKTSYKYYKIAKKGHELLKFLDAQINDEVPVQISAQSPIEPLVVKSEEVVEDWIVKYNALFPKNMQVHPKTLLERFEKFQKTFPEYYNPDLILKATSLYIKEAAAKENGLDYVRKSHYYIWKSEGGTTVYDLADWCKRVLDKKNGTNSEYDLEFLNLA